MPEIYSELTPPTTVTHSLRLPFTSSTSDNLVLARTTLLQIFRPVTHATELTAPLPSPSGDAQTTDRRIQDRGADEDQGDFAADLTLQRATVEDVTKLVLVAECPLYGEVSGMVPIRRNAGEAVVEDAGTGDALLVSFRDAKAAVLAWDPGTCGIVTISLHYYEREEFYSPVVVEEALQTELVVDPANRAALLRFAGDMLAILPVRHVEDEELELDVEMKEKHEDVLAEEDDDDDWDPSAPMKEVVMKEAPTVAAANGKQRKESTARAADGKSELVLKPSFVVSASQLDNATSHVISLKFLHEYREPTLGILYQPVRTWTGWLAERKDTVSYVVITLDLEQKACTALMSVQKLPFDLFKIIPLVPPIGGSLLIGGNEIIHVDQAGKTTGVAVNPYYKKVTDFGGLADQSDLCLALEGSEVVELEGEGGDMLLILRDGTAAIITFKLDGRNVSGVKVSKIANHPGPLVGGTVTTATSLGSRRLFIACAEGDAKVLKWKRVGDRKPISRTVTSENPGANVEDMYDMIDDDDLYGGGTSDLSGARKDSIFALNRSASIDARAKGEYLFQTHDRLVNLGPFRSVTLGRPVYPSDAVEKQKGACPDLEIMATSGPINTPEDGGLALIRRSLAPTVVGRFEFPACRALWTVRSRSARSDPDSGTTEIAATGAEESKRSGEEDYERYLFVSKSGESQVFRVNDAFEELRGTDFEPDGETLEVGVVGDGGRVVQVVAEQVRVYDCDMGLAQIIPMADDETGDEGPPIVKAKICDPYVILLRLDGSVMILKLDKSMELVQEDPGTLMSGLYSLGSLYKARKGEVTQSDADEAYILTLLTDNGTLQIYDLADVSRPLFVASHFAALPPILKQQPPPSESTRHPAKEDIVEIALADLGDQVAREPYLIVRNPHNDLTIYKLFRTSSGLTFAKICNPVLSMPRQPSDKGHEGEEEDQRPMTALENVGGYACVFLPGPDPAFVLKSAHGIPHIHRLSSTAVRSLATFHTANADRGFVYIDSTGVVRVSLLPADWSFDGPWSSRKIYLNESIRAVAWYDSMSVYIAATTKLVPFSLDEEDGHVNNPEPGVFYPQIDTSSVVIVNPLTWTIVDRHKFAYNEVALVVAAIPLEVSEHTHERRQLIAVGTGIFRGEDQAARGGIYVFEVIEVVPEPGKPETNRKLKLVTREEVKGTVSAICGVNGYLLAAQGQKIMVRGLKEDQSLLPVAFMDMNCYVSVAKSLDGLVLFGDFLKSVWFTGFSEEPYKMTLFGKDSRDVEVMAAEFLPDGKNLYFVVADAGSNLWMMQYDPEHPRSLAGQRLIRKAAFHTGHEISSLTLLPRPPPTTSTAPTSRDDQEGFLVLAASRSGSLATISPINENSYRRLNIMQSQIMTGEEHTAGLNPKAFVYVKGSEKEMEMLGGVLDGRVLEKWTALAVGRRAEMAGKAGLVESARREVAASRVEGGLTYL